ncbi:hypothetical protein B0H21DRAFT_785422 [Amylocystis lapponica]|nr:hypothetical protein B0H21DRAFT_785422 [Amylocystis lapponica]
MAHLATQSLLNELKAIYPHRETSGPEAVIGNPWYLVAAVTFSASNRAAAVPVVFEFVLTELKLAQSTTEDEDEKRAQRLLLARRFREALLHSGLLSGLPRAINSCIALNAILTDDLRDKEIVRNTKGNLEDFAKSGRKIFKALYRETADPVQALLDAASPDLGWFCNTIGYGVTTGGTNLLTQVEVSYGIVAALIAVDASRQIVWHLANTQHSGATLEQAKAVRKIAMTVAEKSGVVWEAGIPEVV